MDLLFIARSTICSGSSDPFYVVTYNTKWVTNSWTYSMQVGTCWFVAMSEFNVEVGNQGLK